MSKETELKFRNAPASSEADPEVSYLRDQHRQRVKLTTRKDCASSSGALDTDD